MPSNDLQRPELYQGASAAVPTANEWCARCQALPGTAHNRLVHAVVTEFVKMIVRENPWNDFNDTCELARSYQPEMEHVFRDVATILVDKQWDARVDVLEQHGQKNFILTVHAPF